jgi:murein DD-endopeptidase MepM/ murein hydrolase activator NlpD
MKPCNDKGGYRSFTWTKDGTWFHNGHDYNVPSGTQIISRWCGEVVYVNKFKDKKSLNESEGVIVIRHSYEDRVIYGIYIHLVPNVNVGQVVIEGECIGILHKYQTKTFRADHLHHAIWDSLEWKPPRWWGYVKDLKHYKNPLNYK